MKNIDDCLARLHARRNGLEAASPETEERDGKAFEKLTIEVEGNKETGEDTVTSQVYVLSPKGHVLAESKPQNEESLKSLVHQAATGSLSSSAFTQLARGDLR